jgi:hypothetical protein
MAVESFYQNRTLAPLWLDRGVANARATAVIARLKEADACPPRCGRNEGPSYGAGLHVKPSYIAQFRSRRPPLEHDCLRSCRHTTSLDAHWIY